ncbi:MAG TPA: PDZ domain-containing protein [Vicinamibacteria bacterium]|nr:PDZ domain-containing protein [Vicinamibacteria bacterium]
MLLSAPLLAQEPVRYEIRFDNADHHEAEVTAEFRSVPEGVLELSMSRSSPGRYALHEFAKNLYNLRAEDGAGRALAIERKEPSRWDVSGHDGTVVVRYTLFGDRLDGTYLAIDNTHAHLNMPAAFLWARGMESRPIGLTAIPPHPDWKVATQLRPTGRPQRFEAPNLYYFFDSPTEIGPLEMHEWEVGDARIRLALHHRGGTEQGEAFARLARAVVREEIAIFGELPRFDYGVYTFIADYLPYASGDGMEHRNSTVLTASRSLENPLDNIGTLAHEFFHAWNVERIRPRSLEPFDFEEANLSGELWFAEGFTSYYDDLTLKRAGIMDLDRYAREIEGSLDAIVNAPGRRLFSPVGMSERAAFVDAAVSIDPTNRENTYASYYPYGAVLALGLDLSIRERYSPRSLDDFMKGLWRAYGRNEAPYRLTDLETMLAEITDASFARDFFDRYIETGDLPDFERLLALAGLELRRPRAAEVWLGARLELESSELRVVSRPLAGSPLYQAGADRGDRVLEIAGKAVGKDRTAAEALAGFSPGDQISISFDKRGESRKAELTLQGDPTIEVIPFEKAGREVPAAAARFRESWLSSRAAGN